MPGIPLCSRAIEGESEFGDFEGVNLRGNELLCRMVGLPCVQKGTDVDVGVRAIRVVAIGVV